jgi:hypothetical protein
MSTNQKREEGGVDASLKVEAEGRRGEGQWRERGV